MLAQRVDQRVYGRYVRCKQHRAVKEDGHNVPLPLEGRVARRVGRGRRGRARRFFTLACVAEDPTPGLRPDPPLEGEGDDAAPGLIVTRFRNTHRLGYRRIRSGQPRQSMHQRCHIRRAALAEITEQSVQFGPRQRRAFDQPLVLVMAFARQQRKLDAALARHRRELVAAVTPPVVTAENADQNNLGVTGDAVDPEVDRHRMAEVAKCRQPHRRQPPCVGPPGSGQSGEVAIGKGQGHDIRRCLPEIDRLGDVVERGGCRG